MALSRAESTEKVVQGFLACWLRLKDSGWHLAAVLCTLATCRYLGTRSPSPLEYGLMIKLLLKAKSDRRLINFRTPSEIMDLARLLYQADEQDAPKSLTYVEYALMRGFETGLLQAVLSQAFASTTDTSTRQRLTELMAANSRERERRNLPLSMLFVRTRHYNPAGQQDNGKHPEHVDSLIEDQARSLQEAVRMAHTGKLDGLPPFVGLAAEHYRPTIADVLALAGLAANG